MPVDIRQTTTNYVHPTDPNLLNIHKAMKFNSDGEPVVRTHVDGISLQGDVIVDTVSLSSSTLAALESVNVQNNVTATITGTVSVSNFPTTSTVYQGTNPWVVTGNVTVTNFTSTVNISSMPSVSGTVTVSNFTSTVHVDNFPTSVTVTNFTSTVYVANTVTVAQGTSPWVTTGTTRIINSTTDPVPIVGNVAITNSGVPITVDFNFQDASVNPMNNLRVASPGVQWWYTPLVGKDADYRYSEYTTGTNASSAFVQNLGVVTITSGSDASGRVIRNSRRRQKMRPGVSTETYFALNFEGSVTNSRKRKGLFTNYNGVFVQMNNDIQLGVRRRLTDGNLVEELIDRTTWNGDKLDGTGASGLDSTLAAKTATITGFVSKTPVSLTNETVYAVVLTVSSWPAGVDVGDKLTITGCTPFTYNQTVLVTARTGNTVTVVYTTDPGTINLSGTSVMTHTFWHHSYSFMIDFIGTRNTIIRWFLITGTGPVLLHAEDYTGTIGTQWTNAPALPDRAEIENSGAVTSLPSMSLGGTSISIEATADLTPRFCIAYNNTGITYNKQTPNLEYAVLGLSIRAGEPYQRSDIQLQNIQIIDKSNINPQNAGVFFFRLLLNPTILTNDATPTNIGSTSRQWEYTAATTYSGGIELYAGYASQNAIVDVKTALNFLNLGTNYDGSSPDKLVLVVKQLVGGVSDPSIVAMINFIEAL